MFSMMKAAAGGRFANRYNCFLQPITLFSSKPVKGKTFHRFNDRKKSGSINSGSYFGGNKDWSRGGSEQRDGQILNTKFNSGGKKPFRSKTSPQEEIRTEFKKYLTVGLKTQDWSKALLHAKKRLEYNVIDEGKSVNGKLIATILNIYSKAGAYDEAYELFQSIQSRRLGGSGTWTDQSKYYRHVKLTAYHYQIILDACASHSAGTADTTTSAAVCYTKRPHEVAVEILHSMVDNGGDGLSRDVSLPTADIERYPRRGRPGKTPLPTAVHFTSAMLACMSSKEFEKAYDVFLLASKRSDPTCTCFCTCAYRYLLITVWCRYQRNYPRHYSV
jgi:hypothetical protein